MYRRRRHLNRYDQSHFDWQELNLIRDMRTSTSIENFKKHVEQRIFSAFKRHGDLRKLGLLKNREDGNDLNFRRGDLIDPDSRSIIESSVEAIILLLSREMTINERTSTFEKIMNAIDATAKRNELIQSALAKGNVPQTLAEVTAFDWEPKNLDEKDSA